MDKQERKQGITQELGAVAQEMRLLQKKITKAKWSLMIVILLLGVVTDVFIARMIWPELEGQRWAGLCLSETYAAASTVMMLFLFGRIEKKAEPAAQETIWQKFGMYVMPLLFMVMAIVGAIASRVGYKRVLAMMTYSLLIGVLCGYFVYRAYVMTERMLKELDDKLAQLRDQSLQVK